jgi:hypothetical protein
MNFKKDYQIIEFKISINKWDEQKKDVIPRLHFSSNQFIYLTLQLEIAGWKNKYRKLI